MPSISEVLTRKARQARGDRWFLATVVTASEIQPPDGDTVDAVTLDHVTVAAGDTVLCVETKMGRFVVGKVG